jgi:hypothetical protein
MIVRSLDVLDLPLLPRYRRDLLPLDSARLLTRGNPLGAAAMLAYLDPRRHIYTAMASNNGDSLMGQVTLREDESSARLAFLAPAQNLAVLSLPMMDHMAVQVGEWGGLHLLAEVEEESPAYREMRLAGFATYAWQRVWKLPARGLTDKREYWRPAQGVDWPAVQSLYGQIVPALLSPVEGLPRQVIGLVCRHDGSMQAYVTIRSGPKGVWIQPIVHPDSDCVTEQLIELSGAMSNGHDKPIYVCVRSYQAWLEAVLEDLGAEAGPRQAVMVRRLAKVQRLEEKVNNMEKVLVKPAAPIARVAANQDNLPKE